jgi:hypothetical protein
LHKTQGAGDPGRGTLSLTAVFGDDSDFHAEGAQDRIDGFKAWVRACTQGFVQALPAETGVFGDLRYASRFGYLAERGNEYVRIWVLGGGRKIFRDDRIVIEMRSRVECFVSCFPFPHRFALFNSRAIFFALAMSFVWDAYTPPASKTLHGRSGSRVVDPIPRPDMDTHFGNAFANRFAIAEISKCRATKASQDSGLCFLVVKIG